MDAFDVVYDFLQRRGRVAALSNDLGFLSLLRTTMGDVFAVPAADVPTPGDPARLFQAVAEMAAQTRNILVFVDRRIRDKESTWVFRFLRREYPDIRQILVSEDVEKKRLILYHEMGADNFLILPGDQQSLLRKMALTINPPGCLPALERAARRHLASGDFPKAIRAAWKILAQQPRNPMAHLIIGDAHLGMNRYSHAVESYKLACRHLRIHLEPLARIACVCARQGDEVARLKCLQRMDNICPENPDRKVDMGRIHYGFGNRATAKDLFDDSVRLGAREMVVYLSEILVDIGNVYASGEPNVAERYFRKALDAKGLRLSAEDIATLNRLGLMLRRQGKWRGAVGVYKQALEIDDRDENLFYNIAMAYAEGKEYRNSSKYVMAALRTNARSFWDNAVACYNLGMVFYRCQDYPSARRYVGRSLECEPGLERARKLLAVLSET